MDQPVTISPEALESFKRKLNARGTPNAFIRLGIKGGSCAGFSYVLQFDDDPKLVGTMVWTIDGVNFIIDAKSATFIEGTRIVWHKQLMSEGFDFENPHETTRCGCGNSFAVK